MFVRIMICLFVVLIVGLGSVKSDSDVVIDDNEVIDESTTSEIDELVVAFKALKDEVKRLDMLIKFYHPEWTWTAARKCGKSCPYLVNLLDFQAVQWQFEGDMDGIFDLEFIQENGRMHGNMDFYDANMWLRHCGWVNYDKRAPYPADNGTIRTWTFAKSADGFKLYAEKELLLDYTYPAGKCADMWSGPTVGFYFETPATAVHLLQHGAGVFWWSTEA